MQPHNTKPETGLSFQAGTPAFTSGPKRREAANLRVIAVLNQKGGVGKTTLVVNLSAGLAGLGQRIAAVDLDPQAHLTSSLGVAPTSSELTTFELLKGQASFSQIAVDAAEIKVAPSSLRLSGAELELSSLPGREFLLKEALEPVHDFDFMFLDCPPNLGLLTINALTACNEILIPLQTEYLAMHSLSKLMDTVTLVKKRLNPDLKVQGIIGNRYAKRKRLNREVVEAIGEHFGDKLFKTQIRDNVSLAEAPSFGKDIFTYKPRSIGAEDFSALCREFLERGGS
jgi:chromosome partitioning protein